MGGKRLGLLLVLLALGSHPARAQVHVLPDREVQRVFSGEGRKVSVTLSNSAEAFEADLHTRVYQASSATASLFYDAAWRHVQIPPGQTVSEVATLRFPPVKGETRFLVQWTDGGTRLLGMIEVWVYPPDLLKDLKPLSGNEPIAAFDPLNQIKPLLKTVPVDVVDLEKTSPEDFRGKLAIFGPFRTKTQMRAELPERIKALAGRGVAVLWILPPAEKRAELEPSFYTVLEGKGAVVVVQLGVLLNLSDSPQAQKNLLQLCRQALHPEPPRLPFTTQQP